MLLSPPPGVQAGRVVTCAVRVTTRELRLLNVRHVRMRDHKALRQREWKHIVYPNPSISEEFSLPVFCLFAI